MKIIYVQQHFATARGEAGVRGYNLVRTLVERGHEVTVVCGHNWRDSSLPLEAGRWTSEQMVDGFHVVQLMVHYSNHQGFWRRAASFLLFALLACWEVLKRPADLIFASSTPLTVALPAMAARLLKGTRYVLEVRDLWPDLPIAMGVVRNRFLKWLLLLSEKMAYRWAWRLVALAPGIADGIVKKGAISRDRVLLAPNGADTELMHPLSHNGRTMLPVDDDCLVLGYAGTIGRANGLDALLDTAALLKKRGVDRAAFVLLGDGREKARLQQRATDEGLDNVIFLPLVNKQQYNHTLAEFDVGLQILLNLEAFYYGTSPNKFFDYLAAGKPVLVNYPGWMSDLVTTHDCGVPVAPDDAAAFADAVERLLAEGNRLQTWGANGRRLAEEEFSQREITTRIAEFIEPSRARDTSDNTTHKTTEDTTSLLAADQPAEEEEARVETPRLMREGAP